MTNNRYGRQIRFFGQKGQEKLLECHVAVVGVGGIGSHVVQQLALLGVKKLTLIDSEELSESNRNRYVTARQSDPVPGTKKVDIAERLVIETNSKIHIKKVFDTFISEQAFNEIIIADYIFGCLDSEGARLILNELCAAYCLPYIDLATDIIPGDRIAYGGKMCIAWDGHGCIACYDEIDIAEAQTELADANVRKDRNTIYGVKREELNTSGPSVVSINGILASIGVTEFMLAVTGIRDPIRLLKYYGNMNKFTVPAESPKPDCYYCKEIRGKRESADIQRYIKTNIGKHLR